MATNEEIRNKNIEESNELLAESISLAGQLADKMSFLYNQSKEKYTQDKMSVDLAKQAVSVTKNLKSEYDSIKDVERDIAKNKKLQNEVSRQQKTLEKSIGEEGLGRIKQIKEQEKLEKSLTKQLEKAREEEEAGIRGAKTKARELARQVIENRNQNQLLKENLTSEERQYMLLGETSKVLEENNRFLDEQLRRQENLADSAGLFTSALMGANKALQKLGFGNLAKSLGLDAASAKAKEMIYNLTNGGKKALGIFGKMRVAAGALGAALKTALGPLALIGMATSLFNKFKEKGEQALQVMEKLNQQSVDFSRNLGVSQNVANKVVGEARAIGGAMGMTSDQSTAAATAIYSQLQGTEKLGASTMQTFMKLNVHGGVSAETLGQIHKLSKLSGEEAGKVAENIAKTAQSSIKSMKVNVSMKSVMEGVAKTSNRVRLNFGGSEDAITKAVVQAKKLGLEMNQVEDIAQSLLNFEDSIAAEMEAELLTGRELNLEKAREAALNGDNAALMEELAAQGITAAEFSGMNRMQQEALAKSLGMNAGSMADMLAGQKEATSEEADMLDLQKDSIKAMTSLSSLQEKLIRQKEQEGAAMGPIGEMYEQFRSRMNEIATKTAPMINAVFTELGKIVGPIFDKVTKWLMDEENIKKVTEGIQGAFSFLQEIFTPFYNLIVNLAEYLMPKIQAVWEYIKPTVLSIKDFILDIVKSTSSLIEKLTTGNGEFTTMEKTIGVIVTAVGTFYGTMKLIKATQWAINKATAIYQGAMYVIQGIKTYIAAKNKEEERSLVTRIALGLRDAGAAALKAIAQVTGMSAATLGIAAGVALAAGAGAYLWFNSKKSEVQANDLYSSAPGGGGYGKRTLLAPEGAFSLNNNDTVIAGTNLFKGDDVISAPEGSVQMSNPNARVESLLETLINAVQQGGTVTLDGQKVGEALVVNSYKMQ